MDSCTFNSKYPFGSWWKTRFLWRREQIILPSSTGLEYDVHQFCVAIFISSRPNTCLLTAFYTCSFDDKRPIWEELAQSLNRIYQRKWERSQALTPLRAKPRMRLCVLRKWWILSVSYLLLYITWSVSRENLQLCFFVRRTREWAWEQNNGPRFFVKRRANEMPIFNRCWNMQKVTGLLYNKSVMYLVRTQFQYWNSRVSISNSRVVCNKDELRTKASFWGKTGKWCLQWLHCLWSAVCGTAES